MKLTYLSAVAVLAIALAGPAFAAGATKSSSDNSTKTMNDNGANSLGIDVSQAGSTPDSVKAFIAAQNEDAKKGIESGCKNILSGDTANEPPAVLAFCKNASM